MNMVENLFVQLLPIAGKNDRKAVLHVPSELDFRTIPPAVRRRGVQQMAACGSQIRNLPRAVMNVRSRGIGRSIHQLQGRRAVAR